MNDRGVKLYEEAMEFAYETIGKEHSNTAFFQGTIAGKLTELIVKECAGSIAGFRGWTNGVELGQLIKDHFGVE